MTLGARRRFCSAVSVAVILPAAGFLGCRGGPSAVRPPAASDGTPGAQPPASASAKESAPEPGDHVGQVTVYARGSELIVVAGVGHHGGYYRDVAPVLFLKPSAQDLQVAMDQVRRSADTSGPGPDAPWVVQERLHLGSVAAFYRDVACCIVAFDRQGHATVQSYRPAADGQGFEAAGSELSVADPARLAQTVLDTLAKAPRFAK